MTKIQNVILKKNDQIKIRQPVDFTRFLSCFTRFLSCFTRFLSCFARADSCKLLSCKGNLPLWITLQRYYKGFYKNARACEAPICEQVCRRAPPLPPYSGGGTAGLTKRKPNSRIPFRFAYMGATAPIPPVVQLSTQRNCKKRSFYGHKGITPGDCSWD